MISVNTIYYLIANISLDRSVILFWEVKHRNMPNKSVLKAKQEVVKNLADKMQNSVVGVLVDYRGITVELDTILRRKFREAGVEYSVIRNRMAKFAIKDIGYEELDSSLSGPTSLATSSEDLIAPAKILVEFAKENDDIIEIKAGFLEGKVVDVETIKKLASLPSKEELIAKMLGSLNSPIAGLANVCNGNITGLVRALEAVRAQKEAA